MASFYNGNSWSKSDAYYESDGDFDDCMSAEDYDRKEYYRNGWEQERYERQRW